MGVVLRGTVVLLALLGAWPGFVRHANALETLESAERGSRSVFALLHGRLEPSGVALRGDFLYVVFDNTRAVARLRSDLKLADPDNVLIELGDDGGGFEGITYDAVSDRFYAVTETVPRSDAGEDIAFHAELTEFDAAFRVIRRAPLDFPFESENKGFEGVAHARHGGELYLLLLCEGNRCRGGRIGRTSGQGRVQVYRRHGTGWEHVGTVELPDHLPFEDYSGIDVDGDRLVVTSQASSRLWIGELDVSGSTAGDPEFEIDGRGELFRFDKGKRDYCNVEGIAFAGNRELVAVSDRRKGDQSPRCAVRHESVHTFFLP